MTEDALQHLLSAKEESSDVSSSDEVPDESQESKIVEPATGKMNLCNTKQDTRSHNEPGDAIQRLEHPENAILKLLGSEFIPTNLINM